MADTNVKSDSTQKPAKPRRRWYQFTLRTAGLWIALFCLLLGSFAWWRDRAERQRKVVEELRGLGATVVYRYFSLTNTIPIHTDVYDVPIPVDEFFICAWLRSWFGEDFVSSVDSVYLANSEDAPAVPADKTRRALQLLRQCPHLTSLDLEANAVRASEFEQLPCFSSIEVLTLVNRPGSVGLLSDDSLTVLERASRLSRLELKGQPIGSAGVSHFRNCRHLRFLVLKDTMVGDDGLHHLSDLTELESLDLSGTRVSDAGLKQIRDLKKLNWLALENLGITGEGLAYIGQLPRLEQLDLSDSNITDEALEHLMQFPRLSYLSLFRTKVTGKGIPQFANFPKVGSLWLSGCPLTDENVAGIEIPEGINDLWLSDTNISDVGFCQLKLAKTIYKVDLRSTSIGDASLDHLHALPDLIVIELKNTKVTPAGTQRLKARFPKCTIHN